MSNIKTEELFQEKIAKLLTALGLSATVIVDTVEIEGRTFLKVDMEGEELGVLIGYHGKMLDSLKLVLSLMAPASEDGASYSILLDVNGYHAKREEYIRDLAVRAIDQVMLTAQPIELLPMKPSDRRVVHMTVAEHKGVSSESTGEGDERRVIVLPE